MLWLVQYWYLSDKALSQKRRRFFAVANWTALSVSRAVSLHMGCCQSIVVNPVISAWSVINLSVTWNNCLKNLLDWFLVDRKFSCEGFSQMNCSLKSDRQKYTTNIAAFTSRFFHWISRTETISLSHVRHVIFWYLEIVWPNFVTAFGFWVSWSDEIPRTYWIFKNNSGVPGLLLSRRVSS